MTERAMDHSTSTLEERPRYWAFISDSHRDEGWAKRLHRALETYRLPKKLVGSVTRMGQVPARLFPIFRDRDELPTSADLGANIKDALARARSLIVLCSPAAATSRWVNEEVLTFKRLGGEDRILAIIVAGEPNASDGKPAVSPEAECFPPALRFALGPDGQLTQEKTEPIAADVRPGMDGWANAKLKLVAGLTSLNFDALRQRSKIRRRRRVSLITMAVMVLMTGVAGLWQYQERRRHWQLEKQQAVQRAANAFEQGRQELLQGNAMRAVAYLSEAYKINELDEPGEPLRFLLKQAMSALDAQLAVLQGHEDAVQTVVFSPDGQRLATASEDNTVRVWDVSLETRGQKTIAAIVRCKGLWGFDEGRLLPANPDPKTCPPRSPTP